MKKYLAGVLRLTHMGITAFIVLGCFLPWRQALWAHLILVPIMIAHWKLNGGRCVLTDWEHRLLKRKPEVSEPFVKSLLRNILGITPSEAKVQNFILAVSWTCWTISLGRLFIPYLSSFF